METTKLDIKKSNINGVGIFLREKVSSKTHIRSIQGKLVKKRIKNLRDSKAIKGNWIGVDIDTWINTDHSIFRFINHSCEPNVAIINKRDVVAIRDIEAGEEIVMDYSLTDADPFWSIPCKCGSIYCREKITSIHSVPPTTILRHLPNIPNTFQRIYIENYIISTQSKHA